MYRYLIRSPSIEKFQTSAQQSSPSRGRPTQEPAGLPSSVPATPAELSDSRTGCEDGMGEKKPHKDRRKSQKEETDMRKKAKREKIKKKR